METKLSTMNSNNKDPKATVAIGRVPKQFESYIKGRNRYRLSLVPRYVAPEQVPISKVA